MHVDRPFSAPDTPLQWTHARPFRVAHVDLDIMVDPPAPTVVGTVTHHLELPATVRAAGSVAFDQQDLIIVAVRVDGQAATFSPAPGQVIVCLPGGVGARCQVAIDFRAEHPVKGWYTVRPDAAGRVAMGWTQGAMEDHHHWFPCVDTPNGMSSYRIQVKHRTEHVAIANGDRESRTDHGDGWSTTVHRQAKPHVLYLLNVVVGDLIGTEQPGSRVPITHWLPRGAKADALPMFRATPFALGWLAEYTGTEYPWSRYGHAVVHRFLWGGMENTTLTTITDRVLMTAQDQEREEVDCDALVVHELVHQWFGDLCTMKAWSDIWLNESFATYFEARCTAAWRAHREGVREEDALAQLLWADRQAYLEEDASRYRRALVTNRYDDAYELFDRVSYEKGGIVLHHLCRWLSEERFRAALRVYLGRHAHDSVETNDWLQAVEDATGEPLDWFAHQWLHRPGHPRLKVRHRHDPVRDQLIIEIEQVQAAKDASLLYRLPTRLAWGNAMTVSGSISVELTQQKHVVVTACAKAPVWVALDPDGDLPAAWDEEPGLEGCLARIACPSLGAQARARAAVAAGALQPVPTLITGLKETAGAGVVPELVRAECLNALGALRIAAAGEALLATWNVLPQRLRRTAAAALAQIRGDASIAERVVALADGEAARVTAGELLAARGAMDVPGASPLLRSRMAQPSWQERSRAACVRGLGVSGEAPAIDDVLGLINAPGETDAVRGAAAKSAAKLAQRHVLAVPRVREALVKALDDDSMAVRSAAAGALGDLADPGVVGALATRLAREPFGNVRRVLREAIERLGKAAAERSSLADANRRIGELESAKTALERRLEALEKRLG